MTQNNLGNQKVHRTGETSILKEAENEGVKKTMDRYGLYPATFYYWKKRYGNTNADGGKHVASASTVRKLEKENAVLKQLLAEKELESKYLRKCKELRRTCAYAWLLRT